MLPARTALLLLLAVSLLAPAAEAQDPRGDTWTVHVSVEAVVSSGYATVRVVADIANRGPDPEFPFQVRIPDDAYVTGLVVERDGVVHEAVVKDREEARADYEDWKAQERTGGLVEKTRRTNVYAYLINVEAATSVRATLTYEQHLRADRGIHHLGLEAPVSGFGRDLGASFQVTLRDPDGVDAAWGTPEARVEPEEDGFTLTHTVGPRPGLEPTPFEVSFLLPPTPGAGSLQTTVLDGTGFFVHRFRAPADAERMPLDLVLVLDVSGSMTGQKMAQMQDAATQLVRELGPRDRLHLVSFSSQATPSWPGLKPMDTEGRARASHEISGFLAGGGTHLEDGARRGFAAFEDASAQETRDETRLRVLAFLTDGQASAGVQERGELRRIAREANTAGAAVFAVAFGHDADWSFVRGLAEDGRGAALRVPVGEGAEVDLRRFLTTLATPVLKDVHATYGPGVIASRTGAPILFAGSELLVVGTFDPALGLGSPTVHALASDGPRTYAALPEEGAPTVLPRIVAYERIRALEALVAADGAEPGWIDEIRDLALRHGFVTDETSLVVRLDPRARELGPLRFGDMPDFRPANVPGQSSQATPSGVFQPAASVPGFAPVATAGVLAAIATALRRREVASRSEAADPDACR